ncbi:MAG: DUF2817 domain-containing protein [Bdellovibrionaceae bacterium]|nr:DUF2817 domain-containing protein [Pseudobdellovibrionaceae bacterium]MBX3033321.1 DUF2817 domain-containing protein [Pseudobdellovibrionaceae bacterium]
MKTLEEITEIERLTAPLGTLARTEVLARADEGGLSLPIYKVTFGTTDPAAPVLGLVGGVHGLERIGAQVCVSLLNSLSQLVLWDRNTQSVLEKVRVFFIPTVNPWGILTKHRCNPGGVDLMRNAPVEALGKVPWMLGGQRYSRRLPWYRGENGAPLQPEAQALVSAVEKEIRHSPLSITVDFHSGFGLQDRIWFPYAKTVEPYPDVGLMHSFTNLLERTYPHHFYRIEPQAVNYTTHGDLWDYLYDRHLEAKAAGPYLPLAVEMGSWNWVKKNPFQFFSADGSFNPVKRHRLRRVLRRHNTFFEFLLRAISSPEAWANLNEEQKMKHQERALQLWYAHLNGVTP